MKTRLVRASKLPTYFRIPTLWAVPIRGRAERLGSHVRIVLVDRERGGCTVLYLKLSQRVRIITKET